MSTPAPPLESPLPPPPAGNPRLGRLILIGTSVVMVAVAIVMLLQRQPTARGQEDVSGRIELTIIAPRPGTKVRIDGALAGTTPLSIKLKGARTRPMRVEGAGVTVDITPDRDQIVNLVKPK